MTIDVLGMTWTIEEHSVSDDDLLRENAGYCDVSCRKIVLEKDMHCIDMADVDAYRRSVLRHEIIHAAMFESGLSSNWQKPEYGQDETTVDWIALQFYKLAKIFKQAGCEECL